MQKLYRLTEDGPHTRALVDMRRLTTDPLYRPPSRYELAAARYRDWLNEKKPPGATPAVKVL